MNIMVYVKSRKDFNPLASERRDKSKEEYKEEFKISIHSPLRGETVVAVIAVGAQLFQSTRL